MKLKYLLAASVAGLTGAVVLPAPVVAQQITSGVEGTVLAEDGTAIPGATVVVKDERTGAARTVTASMAGAFRADSLTTGGPYTITVTAPGYEGQSLPGQTISLQGNTAFTFRLAPAAGEENVIVVSGARVQVTQLAVGPGTSFGERMLETAPTFNRDIRDVLRLDPRVNLARDDLSGQDRISCLGGNDRSNAFTIDGISQSDVYGLNDTASPRARPRRCPMTRSAKPRSSSRRLMSTTATSPAARSTSSQSRARTTITSAASTNIPTTACAARRSPTRPSARSSQRSATASICRVR